MHKGLDEFVEQMTTELAAFEHLKMTFHFFSFAIDPILFSSREPKAHKVSLWYEIGPASIRPYTCVRPHFLNLNITETLRLIANFI